MWGALGPGAQLVSGLNWITGRLGSWGPGAGELV